MGSLFLKHLFQFLFHPERSEKTNRWTKFLLEDVAHDNYLEHQMMILTFATGVLDAMTLIRYNVYTSKQGGNIVTMVTALTATITTGAVEWYIVCSVVTFLAGCAIFGHIGRILRFRRRLWIMASQAVQVMLFAVAAALLHFWRSSPPTRHGAKHYTESDTRNFLVVGLLSASEGGLIASAKNMKIMDLNTADVTSATIRLVTDSNCSKHGTRALKRRLEVIGALAGGALCGALLEFRSEPSKGAAVLLFVISIRAIVVVSFLFNAGAPPHLEKIYPGKVDTKRSHPPHRDQGDALGFLNNWFLWWS